jgi:LemA protein
MQATSPVDKAAVENQLTGALKSLFAVAENYPQLKASGSAELVCLAERRNGI